jgi:hypothetical protein
MVGIGASTERGDYDRLFAAGFYTNLNRVNLWMEEKYPDKFELADALRNPAKIQEAHRALGLPKDLPGSQYVGTLLNPESTLVHLDYVTKLIGFDHVGIGTDLEMYLPKEYPWMLRGIAGGLLKRKYTDEQITKIFHGNFLRVFADNPGAA